MNEHTPTSAGYEGGAWPSLGSLPSSPPPIGGPPPAPFRPSIPPPLPPGGFGSPGAPPPAGPSSRRRWYVASAVVLVVAILATAAIVGYRRGQTTDAAAPASTTTPTTSAPTSTSTTQAPTTTEAPSTSIEPPTTAPGAPVDPQQAAVDAEVVKLEQFVEGERGLQFKQPVKVVVMDDKSFVAHLKEVSDKDRDPKEEEKANDLLHAVGLIPLDVDYATAVEQASAGAVGGFYNPEDKELVVRGDQIGPFERSIIAHELTHALDDQWFDLNRKFEDSKDETSFGFSALVEGNARHVENNYIAQLTKAEQREYDQGQTAMAGNSDLSGIPPAILQLMIAPYDLGEPMVKAQLDQGGLKALDKDFADAPTTSEQVMHPAKYLAREGAKHVDVPPTDGTVVDDGSVGELATMLMLQSSTSRRDAATAAAGWGGDWSVLYTQGRNVCVRIDYVMDSANDLQELQRAFTAWAADEPGRSVTTPGAGGLRVTACVAK